MADKDRFDEWAANPDLTLDQRWEEVWRLTEYVVDGYFSGLLDPYLSFIQKFTSDRIEHLEKRVQELLSEVQP